MPQLKSTVLRSQRERSVTPHAFFFGILWTLQELEQFSVLSWNCSCSVTSNYSVLHATVMPLHVQLLCSVTKHPEVLGLQYCLMSLWQIVYTFSGRQSSKNTYINQINRHLYKGARWCKWGSVFWEYLLYKMYHLVTELMNSHSGNNPLHRDNGGDHGDVPWRFKSSEMLLFLDSLTLKMKAQ